MTAEETLHVAVCQAVAILNAAPEVVKISEGRRVRDILRESLVAYADAVMEAPVSEREVQHMKKIHRKSSKGTTREH